MKPKKRLRIRLPFRHEGEKTRGQALVEFALILPLLLLLLLLAIDFGRVFFGWVALNNAARIAASEAGFNPNAWKAPGNATQQGQYRLKVLADMNAINCAPPGGGAWTTAKIPDPTFINVAGSFSSDPYEVGDHSRVKLACSFSFLTPLVGAILGNQITISATAEFPVRGGQINGIVVATPVPTPTPAPCAGKKIVPNMVGQKVSAARSAWTAAGFTGAFTPASGFDTDTVTGQTTNPVSSPGDCLPPATTVTVAHQAQCTAPQLIGLTANGGKSPYQTAGFTGTYTINRPPNNNYTIGSQSLVGGQVYVCSSNMTVFK